MTLFYAAPWRRVRFNKRGLGRVKKILVPIDHSPDPQTALSKASLLAQGLILRREKFVWFMMGSPLAVPEI